ncbi:MAG: ATP synthase subunit I [Candidatus Acidiferrales bacterium]
MSETQAADKKFVDAAIRRIGWMILVLILPGAAVAAWQWGWTMAVAFALGGLLAYANYRWIVSIVGAMLAAGKAKPPKRAYAKLLLPLVLLAALVYVIFSRSLLPVTGILAGFFLLVIAAMLEALYEVARGPRR